MAGLPRIFRALGVLATTAALLAFAGCKREIEAENRAEREANSKKVTADSSHDATEPIVDEGFGFRLELPGPGWKLLREQDALRIHSDACAAGLHISTKTYGVIVVERLPGTTLEQAAAVLWDEELPGSEFEPEQDLEFQGVPAKRRVYTAKLDGRSVRFISTVFIRQEHLYQLMSWSLSSDQSAPLLAFHEAVNLLEGEVEGRRSIREPVTHADGVGWRIRDGRYESALSGLRLRLPEGWRYVIGDERQPGSSAEIALLNEDFRISIALTVERVSKARREVLAGRSRRLFEDDHGAPVGEPLLREVAGERVELRRYDKAPFGYLHGVYVGDDAITQVLITYPLGVAKTVAAPIDAVFPGFERVPSNERAKLHQELLSAPNRQRHFALNRAYRAGEFLDFHDHLRWTTPPGFWQIDSFDDARSNSTDTVLFATEAELGVYARLEVFDAGTTEPADTLDGWIGTDELRSRDTVVIDGLTVHRARTVDQSSSPPMSYAMAVTRREDRMIAMLTWSADDSPAIQAAMQAAIAGLDYDFHLDPAKVVGQVYTDVRHGFSFEIPTGFDEPKIVDLGRNQLAAWTKGNQELASIVVPGVNSSDEAWISSFAEQVLRDRIGTSHPLGKPARSEGKLGAHAVRRLTWDHTTTTLIVDILVRDAMVYFILYVNLSDTQLKAVRTNWALLE